MKRKQGLFITFEGIDGSGKTTQMALCAEHLQAMGDEVVLTRNPGGTNFGQELRNILLHSQEPVTPLSELLLFMADRAQHLEEVVIPATSLGKIVLCDRYHDSTFAYQGYGRGLDLSAIEQLNQLATSGRNPDITFLFDGDPAILRGRVHKRGASDRMEAEQLSFYQKVRDGYLTRAKAEPNRIHVLNALESIETLQAQVVQALQTALPEVIQAK